MWKGITDWFMDLYLQVESSPFRQLQIHVCQSDTKVKRQAQNVGYWECGMV